MKALGAGLAWFALFLVVALILEVYADPSPKPGMIGPWTPATEWSERTR